MLEKNNWIIFKSLVGSHAYGTASPKFNSDIDYRGVFVLPLNERISIKSRIMEVGQEKPIDIKYYEISKFFDLAKDCNPNIIEFLFMPDDCIEICTEIMKKIILNRNLFISKKAYHTFSGYAYAQIKKAKGENKWVNNPKPQEPPKREDFCWFIRLDYKEGGGFYFDTSYSKPEFNFSKLPYRPVSIKEIDMCLNDYHVAALEHVPDTYRLYYYGTESKGVFRNGNLVCESIPMNEEVKRCVGLLIYNDQEYQKAMLDWKNYWTWIKERNPNRWIAQENKTIDYDAKNLYHCLRLLISGESILKTGAPIVRFEGKDLEYLRNIRSGNFSYEELMKDVEVRMANMEILYKESNLPYAPNIDSIDSLFKEIILNIL